MSTGFVGQSVVRLVRIRYYSVIVFQGGSILRLYPRHHLHLEMPTVYILKEIEGAMLVAEHSAIG